MSCSNMSAPTPSTARCWRSSAAAGWSPAARPRARSTTINLMQLFQQQYRIIGSFGASMRNIRESLAKMAARNEAGDRHRGGAGRFRARPRATGKPAGVRQSRRALLTGSSDRGEAASPPILALRLRRARQSRCGRAASAGWPSVFVASGAAGPIPTALADVAGMGHAQARPLAARSTASAAPISPPPSRKNPPPRSNRSCAASGTISAASAPNSPISTASGTTIRHTPTEGRIVVDAAIRGAVRPAARRRQAGADLRRASRQLGTARARRRLARPRSGDPLSPAEHRRCRPHRRKLPLRQHGTPDSRPASMPR